MLDSDNGDNAARSGESDLSANVRDMAVATQRTRRQALCTRAHCSMYSETTANETYLRDKSDAREWGGRISLAHESGV